MPTWEKLDTVMSLIRSAEMVPEKDRPGVYKAAKGILKDNMSKLHELAKFLYEQVPVSKHAELVESQLVCSFAYACSEQNSGSP